MTRVHLFADEAGNFDFSGGRGASRYFIIASVTCGEPDVGNAMLHLRRQLLWEGLDVRPEGFHATEDKQAVRDRVFAMLTDHDLRIDATIFEKRNVRPHLIDDEAAFYRLAWFLHFKFVGPRIVTATDELMVTAAALSTKRRRAVFAEAVHDVVAQVSPTTTFRAVQTSSESEPCLWAADYCAWAIQRKWERGDERSYVLIRDQLESEVVMFARGR